MDSPSQKGHKELPGINFIVMWCQNHLFGGPTSVMFRRVWGFHRRGRWSLRVSIYRFYSCFFKKNNMSCFGKCLSLGGLGGSQRCDTLEVPGIVGSSINYKHLHNQKKENLWWLNHLPIFCQFESSHPSFQTKKTSPAMW